MGDPVEWAAWGFGKFGYWGLAGVFVAVNVALGLVLWRGVEKYRTEHPARLERPQAAESAPPLSTQHGDGIDEALARLARLRDEVASLGSARLARPSGVPSGDSKTLEQQVADAVAELPQELRIREATEATAYKAELKVQIAAEEMEVEFRPRVSQALALVKDVISAASNANLITLVEQNTQQLPPKIAFSSFALNKEGVEPLLQPSVLTARFSDGFIWRGHIEAGQVESPPELRPRKFEGTDRYFPMVRIIGERDGRSEPLAVIHYDLKTKVIGASASISLPPERKAAIESIVKQQHGDAQVRGVLLELIKAQRLQEFLGS
jgi:hypothetical protein